MMIQFVKKIGLILFLMTLIFVIDINAYAETEPVSVVYFSAAEYDYPPFSLETNGEPDGFSVELLKEVAIEMGISIEFKMDYWSIIKQELIDGELDILPIVGYTRERDAYLDFTVPYIVLRGNIFVRDGGVIIQSANDLLGKQVLVLEGDNSEEYARSIGLDEELITTTTYTEAFQLLASGQYDAVLAQGLVGEQIIAEQQINNVSPVYIFDDDGVSKIKLNLDGYEQKFSFAVLEGNHELLSILNEGLSIVSANGTYDRLYSQWFPFLINQTPSLKHVLEIVFPILIPLIILMLGASIIIVRKQVKRQTRTILKTYESNQIILEAFDKRFDSEKERYSYFLEEALKLSDSDDGIMFKLDKDKKIKMDSIYFGKVKSACSLEEVIDVIEHMINECSDISKPVQKVINDFQVKQILPQLNTNCLNDIKHVVILSFKTEIGEMFYTLLANKPTIYSKDDLTQISILISGFVSMIDRYDYLRQIEHLSYHDSLTGLYNRRYVEEKIQELNQEEDYPISIVFADVNKLKEVNDTYGHLDGDELLKKAGELIKSHSGDKDIVARWGGDEFVVIKSTSNKDDVKVYVDLVSSNAEQTHLKGGAISIAFGHAVMMDKLANIDHCFVEAEKMMYQHKEKMSLDNY